MVRRDSVYLDGYGTLDISTCQNRSPDWSGEVCICMIHKSRFAAAPAHKSKPTSQGKTEINCMSQPSLSPTYVHPCLCTLAVAGVCPGYALRHMLWPHLQGCIRQVAAEMVIIAPRQHPRQQPAEDAAPHAAATIPGGPAQRLPDRLLLSMPSTGPSARGQGQIVSWRDRLRESGMPMHTYSFGQAGGASHAAGHQVNNQTEGCSGSGNSRGMYTHTRTALCRETGLIAILLNRCRDERLPSPASHSQCGATLKTVGAEGAS